MVRILIKHNQLQLQLQLQLRHQPQPLHVSDVTVDASINTISSFYFIFFFIAPKPAGPRNYDIFRDMMDPEPEDFGGFVSANDQALPVVNGSKYFVLE